MNKLALLMFVAACGGGGDDGDGNNPDANQPPRDAAVDARPVDAPPVAATVLAVDCATVTPVQTVTTVESPTRAFSPDAITIQVNDVVKFTPSSSHSVVPREGMPSDPGLKTGFGEVKCLRFTVAGAFNYRCNPHTGMTGVVNVQ